MFAPAKYYLEDSVKVSPSSPVYIESKDLEGKLWSIYHGKSVINSDYEREWEPLPSSRSEDFLKRTRFSRHEAERIAIEYWRREIRDKRSRLPERAP